MSIAGRRSNQGDEYQLCVALHWLIQLLGDDSIESIQVDSTGIPGQSITISVDDIVVLYKTGFAIFIQAKKNQPEHESWSLRDRVLQGELRKARDQLESKANSEVRFYSRSPFGSLKALVEDCNRFPDYLGFQRDAPGNQSEALKKLAKIVERSLEETFALARRFRFGSTLEFEEWDRRNWAELDRLIPRADLAKPILERYLSSHEASLRDSKSLITREEIFDELAKHGLSPTPKRDEAEILAAFELASQIGYHWLRTIDSQKISRSELSRLLELIEQGSQTILLTDRPGSGKTCLLLDLADAIRSLNPRYGLLFIKGDQFAEINSEQDLVTKGLPEDLVGQCARLASSRRVVVIIDSLDVLSLSRQHRALKVFLGLLDRLEKIPNVTTIAACRQFDLQYDPLLRGRSWQQTVHLEPLNFDQTVRPFLICWGIDPDHITPTLRELLQLPQHLRIYEKLAKLGKRLSPASAYELYDSFLEEVVIQNSQLGDRAMAALHSMADHLMQTRTSTCPKATFAASEEMIRLLISQEVLWNPSHSSLSFSHQTLSDCLVVRSSLAKSKTLSEFILDYPQLPFIRPAVRAFFFFLRTHQVKEFRRQVWQILSHEQIAYHVKRLVCESLAEIPPLEDDGWLLQRIFHNYPDLFRRLLAQVELEPWFGFLNRHWLPEAQTSADREEWLRLFCWKIGVWLDRHPTEVVALWREAIASQWFDRQMLVSIIRTPLEKTSVWETEGIRELLATLIDPTRNETDYLGHIISHWVQATNSGDDLLWQYITKNVLPDDVRRWELRDQLHCMPHVFHNGSFLNERLKQSDELLNLALTNLECWIRASSIAIGYEEQELQSDFLRVSSWEIKHSNCDIHAVDSLSELLTGVEAALKFRASQNNAWWQFNEPRLRITQEALLRYFTIQAYIENLETNISGIEFQLQDKELISCRDLHDEVGHLMQLSYPYVSHSIQLANQTAILSIVVEQKNEADADNSSTWKHYITHKLLLWIPPFLRTLESQAFVDTYQDHFGHRQLTPEIYSWGGESSPPISPQELLQLSDHGLLKLLNYYQENPQHESLDRSMIGGFGAVVWVLRDACALHPARFIGLFDLFIRQNLHWKYIEAIAQGVSTHLRYRFDNLSPSEQWNPVEPLPDGTEVATTLLKWLERYPSFWHDSQIMGQALRACCQLLNDRDSSDRLTLILFWIHSTVEEDQPHSTTNSERELSSRALNSIHGSAADSAISLCNKLLEQEQDLPELLPLLLRCFARDPAISVRVPILQQLPFLIYKRPDLGWQLLADVFQEPQPLLWQYAERCLYYQYRDHFNQVSPYLDRLWDEGMENAGKMWGRISTLSSLAGHISQETLFERLPSANATAWEGAAQVFAANLDRREHAAVCNSGLIAILQRESVSDKVIATVERLFIDEAKRTLIHRHRDIALAFLNAVSKAEGRHDTYHFLHWLSHEACRDRVFALGVAETFAEMLETRMRSHQIWHSESLIAALNEILREADATDDAALIHRAIHVQDRFLRLNVHGMEALLDKAGQN